MGKATVKKLVSLILNEINQQGGKEVQGFTYIGDDQDLQRYLQATEPSYGAEAELEPEFSGSHSGEMDEMAGDGTTKLKLPHRKIDPPMYIPVDVLELSNDAKAYIPPILCLDPANGEYVKNMCIGDIIMTVPSGHEFLRFENYAGKTLANQKSVRQFNYILLPTNIGDRYGFSKDQPRGNRWGIPINRNVREKLKVEVPGETEEQRDKRLKRLDALYRALSKRFGLFPIINEAFANPEVLDHLDKCLIPETWAISLTTEHPTNKIIVKKYGGDSPEVDVDFVAVRDLENVEKAINDVVELRTALAMGPDDPNLDVTDVRQREREYSKPMQRQHANLIYQNGNWDAKQRAHDQNIFREEGGKSDIYNLLAKSIQEGNVKVVIKSVLEIKGNVRVIPEDESYEYVFRGKFSSVLYHRNAEGAGALVGELFEPIVVTLRKPVGDYDIESTNFESRPEFFINAGRKSTQRIGQTVDRSGFLKTFITKMTTELVDRIDPDEVLRTMTMLVENASEQNTAQPEV